MQEYKFIEKPMSDLRRSFSFAGRKDDPNSKCASQIKRVLSANFVTMSQPRCDQYRAVKSGMKLLPKPTYPLPLHPHRHRRPVDHTPNIEPPLRDESCNPQPLQHWIFSGEITGDIDPFGTRGVNELSYLASMNLIDVGFIID